MKYKYIGLTKVYRHETFGNMKLKDGDIIDDCSIITQNRDCFIEIEEEKPTKKKTRKKQAAKEDVTDDNIKTEEVKGGE